MANMNFMHDSVNGNSREPHRLYVEHYPQLRIRFYKLFNKLHQWMRESGSLAPLERIARSLEYFQLPIWKLAQWEQRKKIPDPVWGTLQLLKVLVFPLCGEFSMSSHFIYTTSSEWKLMLPLAIVQGRFLLMASREIRCKHTVCS
jgi:hypothetical protein